jgi:hypothetical protein
MDDDQQALRRAHIAKLPLASRAAFQKLDQLEKRIAEETFGFGVASRPRNQSHRQSDCHWDDEGAH